jgi:hypothetical protein
MQDGLKHAIKRVDQALAMIGDRLGLDHDRVLLSRFAIPVISSYLDRRLGQLPAKACRSCLFSGVLIPSRQRGLDHA